MAKRILLVVLLLSTLAHAAHNVQLGWTQGTGSGVTGNKCYRGTTKGGPYTLINTSSTPITSWTDNSVTAGATYYYVVTATCATCNPSESGYSNEVNAVIPNDPPAAPTGLTVTVQ